MTKIRIADAARAFLRSEVRYLQTRSPSAARGLLARIAEATSNLSRFPAMGSESDIVRGTRRLVVGDYVLFYDLDSKGVAITAIRHGRMAAEDLDLGDEPENGADPSFRNDSDR